MPHKKKDPFRVELSTITGRLAAYYKLGDLDNAKHWAAQLQFYLIRMGLLVDNPSRTIHNGEQVAESTKTKTGTPR